MKGEGGTFFCCLKGFRMKTIDFNCDLGESKEEEGLYGQVMPVITSANIACGLHAGGPDAMWKALMAARQAGCLVGAHPGFDDKANFGRTPLALTDRELTCCLLYQLGALKAMCQEAGAALSYVKPHGAMYNMAAKDEHMSEVICRAVKAVDPDLILVGLSGSRTQDACAKEGMRFAAEVFADRAYNPDGSLVSRKLPGAVLTDQKAVIDQVLDLVGKGQVRAIDGTVIKVKADTLCMHGDNPQAARFASLIRRTLEENGIKVAPMTYNYMETKEAPDGRAD